MASRLSRHVFHLLARFAHIQASLAHIQHLEDCCSSHPVPRNAQRFLVNRPRHEMPLPHMALGTHYPTCHKLPDWNCADGLNPGCTLARSSYRPFHSPTPPSFLPFCAASTGWNSNIVHPCRILPSHHHHHHRRRRRCDGFFRTYPDRPCQTLASWTSSHCHIARNSRLIPHLTSTHPPTFAIV